MKVAITGTIGSGKSTVARIFRENGYEVYDSDQTSRNLSKKGGLAYNKIVENFDDILDDNDEIDRLKLAKIVFNDNNKKKELENILHPLITQDMQMCMKNKDIFIAEVPVLFEAGMQDYFDEIILVVTKESLLLDRLIKKGLKNDDIESRINNQFSVDIKRELSDVVIENTGDIRALKDKVVSYIKNKLEV